MASTSVQSRFAYTIPEVAQLLHLGRSTVYELIQSGQLDVLHIGRAVRVTRHSLAGFLQVAPDELIETSPPGGRSDKPSPAAGSFLSHLEDATYLVTVRRVFGRTG